MRKATRALDPDPIRSRRLISALRRCGNSEMPCADEMIVVEALLRGLPENECRSQRCGDGH